MDGFRDFIGAPETQKFNIVLFGGKIKHHYIIKISTKEEWFKGWDDGRKASVDCIRTSSICVKGFVNLVLFLC